MSILQLLVFVSLFMYMHLYQCICLTIVRLLCLYLSVISATLREVKFGNDQSMTINNRVAIPREHQTSFPSLDLPILVYYKIIFNSLAVLNLEQYRRAVITFVDNVSYHISILIIEKHFDSKIYYIKHFSSLFSRRLMENKVHGLMMMKNDFFPCVLYATINFFSDAVLLRNIL